MIVANITCVLACYFTKIVWPERWTPENRSELQWEGSEMERLLRLDMDDGKDKSLKPINLYQSRKEYSENYTLSVFRKHVDQVQRRRKMFAYYATKNNNTHS